MSLHDDIPFPDRHEGPGQLDRDERPVMMTQNGRLRAVVLPPNSYHRMRNAIGLLKLVAHAERDVRAGRIVPQDKMFARLADKYVQSGD